MIPQGMWSRKCMVTEGNDENSSKCVDATTMSRLMVTTSADEC